MSPSEGHFEVGNIAAPSEDPEQLPPSSDVLAYANQLTQAGIELDSQLKNYENDSSNRYQLQEAYTRLEAILQRYFDESSDQRATSVMGFDEAIQLYLQAARALQLKPEEVVLRNDIKPDPDHPDRFLRE